MDELKTLSSFSKQCAAISVARHACSRNTDMKRRLAKLNLPLMSVLNRLRRGLVLCSESEFQQHVHRVLTRFCGEVQALVRSLENGKRVPKILALMHAVNAFERARYIPH